MAGPQPLQLTVEKLVAGGDGLAFHEGKAVFVPLALPGETVLATVVRDRRDFSRAELVEVLESSRHRVKPACPIYGDCGGCNLQHLAYARQVEEKSLIVAEALRRTGGIDGLAVPVLPSSPYSYRNRAQLHFNSEGRLGFMRRDSSDIVEAAGCPVAVKPLQAWIEAQAGGTSAFEGLRRHILGKDRFIAFGYRNEVWIEGERGIVEVEVAGERIRFHVKGFFQSNLSILDGFVPDALAGLGGEEAADLYCGVGLFGAFLAKRFSRVTCVEHNPFSLDLAKINVPGAGNQFHADETGEHKRQDSGEVDSH